MSEFKVMMIGCGANQEMLIRYILISDWCRIDSHLPDKEALLLAIGKNNPDVVLFDLDLYAKIDGIKTARTIRFKYNIPIFYVNHERRIECDDLTLASCGRH